MSDMELEQAADIQRAAKDAWDWVVEHLRVESQWRAERQGVEPLSHYEVTAPPHHAGDGVWMSLKATCGSWRVVKNKWGQSFGQDWDGDVFEQVEPMIDVGRNALDLLLGKVADGLTEGFHEAQWPDRGGVARWMPHATRTICSGPISPRWCRAFVPQSLGGARDGWR